MYDMEREYTEKNLMSLEVGDEDIIVSFGHPMYNAQTKIST